MSNLSEVTKKVESNRLFNILAEVTHTSLAEQAQRLQSGIDPRLVSFIAPESLEAEQYRRLRLSVEQLHKPGTGVVVGVSSPLPGEGKTITAINLAGSLAQDKKARVLLIEIDLRRPSFTVSDHLDLGNLNGNGLVHAVTNPHLSLSDVVRYIPRFNLAVLPAGGCPRAPYEVLKSLRMGELLMQARQIYDFVILDAPPIIPVPDCRLIAKWVDGFMMVVSASQTRRPALEEALNLMPPSSVLGIVFNNQSRSQSPYYGYGYGYAYERSGQFKSMSR